MNCNDCNDVKQAEWYATKAQREMGERVVCDAVNCIYFVNKNNCNRKRVNIVFDDVLSIYKCGDFRLVGERNETDNQI